MYSITPPPEKALELPKEWVSIGSTDTNSSISSQQVGLVDWFFIKQIMKHIYKLHIEEEMKKKYRFLSRIYIISESEYTTLRDLKIWLGTWNVNGKKIDENINIWLTGSVTGKPTVPLLSSPHL